MKTPLPDLPLIEDMQQFRESVKARWSKVVVNAGYAEMGQIYCPRCQRYARVVGACVGDRPLISSRYAGTGATMEKAMLPSAWTFTCLQCQAVFYGLHFLGPVDAEWVLFPDVSGGLSTAHTPEGVAYYLDQASRAHAAGANSAAIVMFRAALEHVLYSAGYKDGMCGAKLTALERDLASNAERLPAWARRLSTDDLRVLNVLGNAAVHPNDGNVSAQSALDRDLYIAVSLTFAALLDEAYERPHSESARRVLLGRAVEGFKSK